MVFNFTRSHSHSSESHHAKDGSDMSKDELIQEGEALRETVQDARDLPVTQLLQFLVANNWNHEQAKQQLEQMLRWRREKLVDLFPVATAKNGLPLLVGVRGYTYIKDGNVEAHPKLSETAIRILNYLGGDCFHKFDKKGHPILIDRTGYHQAKEIGSNVTGDEIKHFQVACNEFLNRVIMKEASERAGHPIHKETVIFDCTHMGFWQFHMSGLLKLKQVADYLKSYYPETLAHLFVVNAPSAFLVMWKVVKPWLDTRTLEKVEILGTDYEEELLKYIDSSSLPRYLGGTCDCSHMAGGCVPLHSEKEPYLTLSEDNEKVVSVYATEVMERAKKDPLSRQVV